MSMSSHGLSLRTSGAMSVDTSDSFTRATGMPHGPPTELEPQDSMGGWEPLTGEEIADLVDKEPNVNDVMSAQYFGGS